MKKFLTLITLISALVPAIHGMDTNLPADVQKQYDNLTALIQHADIEAFKPAFDAVTLPAESIASLRQTAAEAKTTVTKELDAMGDKTKNWSKLAKGGLVTFGGFWAGLAVPATLSAILMSSDNDILMFVGIPVILPSILIIESLKKIVRMKIGRRAFVNKTIILTNCLASLAAAYKGFPYGIKTFKVGLNYKEHLQNMLTNLDGIDAYITQAKV